MHINVRSLNKYWPSHKNCNAPFENIYLNVKGGGETYLRIFHLPLTSLLFFTTFYVVIPIFIGALDCSPRYFSYILPSQKQKSFSTVFLKQLNSRMGLNISYFLFSWSLPAISRKGEIDLSDEKTGSVRLFTEDQIASK